MSALAVVGLTKTFAAVRALDHVGLSVDRGEFFSVVGPTNAGKSTLLKTIAGLYLPQQGRVVINGRDVTGLPPYQRKVSLLFQNVGLFPTRTGFDNIAFPLYTAKVPNHLIEPRVHTVASILKIEHVLPRLPRTFSGGEQQRVAIARSIVHPSTLLMLDEPLTNLDARMRISLRIEFKKLHKDLGQTIIYVTHDQVEAMSLSDRIAVLKAGRLQQIGSPNDVYHHPVNRFVAEFIGSPPMNFIDADLSESDQELVLIGKGFRLPLSPFATAAWRLRKPPQRIAFGIRPESIRVGPTLSAETPLPVEVMWVEHLGSKSVLALRLGGAQLKAVVPPHHCIRTQGRAFIGLQPQPQHLLDRDTGVFAAA